MSLINLFNEMTAKIFPHLVNEMDLQIQRALRTPNRKYQKRTSPWHIIIKMPNIQNEDRILISPRENHQVTSRGKPMNIKSAFSTETLKNPGKLRTIRFETSKKINVNQDYYMHQSYPYKIKAEIKT